MVRNHVRGRLSPNDDFPSSHGKDRVQSTQLTRLIMVESGSNDFFPKIGQVAERTDALEDKDFSGQTKEEDDEDRPVEEIESLCMSCGEQVG